jgi:hypothetical protein
MRVVAFFLGLVLIGMGVRGQSVLPEAGTSTRSALPNVIVGIVAMLAGPQSRWVVTALGIALVAFTLLSFVAWPSRRRS